MSYYDNKNNCDTCLILPSLNDIKYLIHEQEELFDMLLLNKLKITALHVMKDSKFHKVALQNRVIDI